LIVAAEAPLVKQFLVFLNLGHSKRLCHLLLDPEPQAANVVEQKVLIFGDLALFLRSGGACLDGTGNLEWFFLIHCM